MQVQDYGLILAFFVLVLVPAPFIGRFIHRAMEGQRTFLTPVFAPVERLCYRIAGVDPHSEQDWKTYTVALLLFNAAGLALLFAILMLQGMLPLNPQKLPGLEWTLAFNTAVSFVSNTNWQAYSGEASLSYFSQMVGLGVQNFVSAAVGLCVLVALARGISRRSTDKLGNFWVDLTRGTLYALLRCACCWRCSWSGRACRRPCSTTSASTPWPAPTRWSRSARRPARSPSSSSAPTGRLLRRQLRAPVREPQRLEQPAGSGVDHPDPRRPGVHLRPLRQDLRQSRALLATMLILFVIGLGVTLYSEFQPNPAPGRAAHRAVRFPGGQESRLGITASALWAVTTTAASNGSVNAMHDSFSAIGGMIPMFNMMLGEVIFGGVGAGLYGMLLFVLIAVFLAGLMIGRTPEYLGKKLEAREVRLLVATLLVMPVGVLVFCALAVSLPGPAASITNPGAHGFSQALYAYTSGTANNGSAFAGFGANTPFHNIMIGLAMLLGRFGYILPVLAIAGSLAAKQRAPVGGNSFPTHGPLFVTLLTLTILLVGGLTFLPALALGPIAEHLALIGL